MGDFDTRLRAPSLPPPISSGVLPPIPDVTLPRPSLLGPEGGSATLDGFAFGSASLTGDHQRKLATFSVRLRQLLDETPGGRIKAVGHTDAVGAEADNERLGLQRADSVRDELVTQGIDAGNIQTHSLGESVPVVKTKQREPRNRRVEVYFSPNSGLKLRGLLTEGLTRPKALKSTPPGKLPPPPTDFDFCKVFPEECDPNRLPPDFYKPIPDAPGGKKRSLTDAIWQPIDKALDRGLRKLGISDKWNKRLRDAAKAGAEKGATSVINEAMDAAKLTGETREAVDAALRAAAQQKVPFQ